MTSSPITGIDHILVAVRDLEAARAAYARLGFTATPRGRHTTRDTANYCLMLERGYIELIGPAGAGPSGYDPLDGFLARREGLLGIAFASDDADAAHAALAAAGLDPSPPEDLARDLELAGGTVRPGFRLVRLPAAATPALAAFICCHLTPEMVRQPDWLAHANGAQALAGVTTVVDDPPALAAAYATLLGPGAVTRTDDLLSVRVGAMSLVFATPGDFARLYPDCDFGADPGDYVLPLIAAMTVTVDDIGRAAEVLAANGAACARDGDRALVVPADAARGAMLEFVPAE